MATTCTICGLMLSLRSPTYEITSLPIWVSSVPNPDFSIESKRPTSVGRFWGAARFLSENVHSYFCPDKDAALLGNSSCGEDVCAGFVSIFWFLSLMLFLK
ncbi:MAG: hypothetical protein ACRC91_10930 [Aeromonas sp.]